MVATSKGITPKLPAAVLLWFHWRKIFAKEGINSLPTSRDSPFMWMEGMQCVYGGISFLTNSPDDKLIRVLWNIYLSLACCEPDFSHKEYNYQKHQSRHIFNKSPSFPQRSSQTLHLGGKKIKNPTHKGESERFNLSTQISAISEDGKFLQMNRSALTEGLMKSDPLLTIKGASV